MLFGAISQTHAVSHDKRDKRNEKNNQLEFHTKFKSRQMKI